MSLPKDDTICYSLGHNLLWISAESLVIFSVKTIRAIQNGLEGIMMMRGELATWQELTHTIYVIPGKFWQEVAHCWLC